jgi:NADH-dependent peroxiredoxin subunit F
MSESYDLIIIGGGPAGASGAVYAARKRLRTAFLTREWGGQSIVSPEIQNWIGTPAISGDELARNLRKHVEAYADNVLTIVAPTEVTDFKATDTSVEATLKDGRVLSARAAFIATGANRRKLTVPGAAEFDQKGLTYCASCDGLLFTGKDVCVVGGGNAAFETALQLSAYCKTVTVLVRSEPRADEITVDAARKKENIRILTNVEILEVKGVSFVSGIHYRDSKTLVESNLSVEGIFVEIGHVPSTEWLGGAAALNESGKIVVDPRTQRTSHPRIWSAGDCTDGLFQQNNIAAGDAVKAMEHLYLALHRGEI